MNDGHYEVDIGSRRHPARTSSPPNAEAQDNPRCGGSGPTGAVRLVTTGTNGSTNSSERPTRSDQQDTDSKELIPRSGSSRWGHQAAPPVPCVPRALAHIGDWNGTAGREPVSDEAQKQVRRGPIAVLLLFVGLLLGSTGGVGFSLESDGSSSQLRQARPAKSALAVRIAPREITAEEDSGDPLVLPPPTGIVPDTAAAHPAAPAGISEAAAPRRPILLGYRARAPPAA